MKNGVGELEAQGWMRLPFRFNASELKNLSKLNPHKGRGQRLSDMQAVSNALPIEFENCIRELGFTPIPNRAVGFAKSQKSNWSLPWHQDRVIAMTRRNDDPAYKNWTRKSGIWHCEPDKEKLKKMAFAYIAFDDITSGMGGLEIAEGSHCHGKIDKSSIASHISKSSLVMPDMSSGDALLISCLALHRSAILSGSELRRTLRIDFTRKKIPPKINGKP